MLLCLFACSADPGQPANGAVGAHVWFASSTGIELTEAWVYDTWGPDAGPPSSGTACSTLDRAAMSSDQLAALAQLVLIPLADSCSVDGYDYHQLTVMDGDGGPVSYRDTGCNFLRVEGATAMLPPGAFTANLFPLTTSISCPQ